MILYVLHEFQYSAIIIVSIFFMAVISWTFFEYFLSRFLFHYQATTGFGKRLCMFFMKTTMSFRENGIVYSCRLSPAFGLLCGFFGICTNVVKTVLIKFFQPEV